MIKQIASSTFSNVYRGMWRYTEVAVKVIKLIEAERDEIITNAKKEIKCIDVRVINLTEMFTSLIVNFDTQT